MRVVVVDCVTSLGINGAVAKVRAFRFFVRCQAVVLLFLMIFLMVFTFNFARFILISHFLNVFVMFSNIFFFLFSIFFLFSSLLFVDFFRIFCLIFPPVFFFLFFLSTFSILSLSLISLSDSEFPAFSFRFHQHSLLSHLLRLSRSLKKKEKKIAFHIFNVVCLKSIFFLLFFSYSSASLKWLFFDFLLCSFHESFF